MNNSVFIPIEIMRREYISKLLLSIELLKKGMPIIIGHKSPVIKLALKTKEPGILFYKSSNKKMIGGLKDHNLESLKKKNFGIVAQDEEAGIVYEDFEDFYKFRHSLKLVGKLDIFFTWGEDEFHFLSKKFNKNIVKNYGALRSCFWGEFGKKFYQNNTEILKNSFGNYILIVSNLPTYNPYIKLSHSKEVQKNYRGFNENEPDQYYNYEKKIFFQYIELVKLLANKLNKTVIVRPHPGESIYGWKKALKGIKNTFIKNEGELLPWILASDFIIQNNCTSAIEASAAKIPVVTYADDNEDLTCLSEGKENIPNKLSINVFGKKHFVEVVKNINYLWDQDINKKKREVLLNRKLKDYGTTKAAYNIAQKIIEFVGKPNPKGNASIGKDSFLFDFYELYRRFNFRFRSASKIMDLNKREPLSYSKIQKDINHLLTIMKIEKKIKLKRVEMNTFYLYPFHDNNIE